MATLSPTSRRIEEAIRSLRTKDVRSTTLERLRATRRADARVKELPQPLQIGQGLYELLDTIAVPVSPHDLILGRIQEDVPDEEGEVFFRAALEQWKGRSIPPWMRDGGHECFAWERLLRLGLSGLETLAADELERRRASGAGTIELDFLRGALRVYQAFRTYARRYAEAARQAGLATQAARCASLAEQAPRGFAEALQLLWLVGHVYCTMLSMNPTLTFGRVDELLLPFHRHDVAAGTLTRQEAGDLIEDFYCKNNLILGRGEHQMGGDPEKDTGWSRNLAYDAPQYIVLGGRRTDGADPASELTELFLERVVPRFENPVVVLRYTSDLPAAVWRLACDKMRANASLIVYNDAAVIPAMIHCGIEPRDALTYTMHGCNWPDIPGKQMAVHGFQPVLPKLLLDAIFAVDGEPSSLEEISEHFVAAFRREIGTHCERLRESLRERAQRQPDRLRVDDCFLDGPIMRGRSWEDGGVSCLNTICAIAGIASAADCFAALEDLVFRSREVTFAELKQALRDDFAGSEVLRQRCLRAPKFGQDDDRADRHAVRVLESVLEEIDRASRPGSADQVVVFRCLETDMGHIRLGRELGATPDGRHAGQPISENTSPSPGACVNGLTAMLRSVAKLPLDRINSGALNLRLQPALFAGEDGLTRLAGVLRTYLDLGGLQVQLSLADVRELRDAQVNPESHRDLMVRITGYSAAFVDMTRRAQEEIIRREEMGPG